MALFSAGTGARNVRALLRSGFKYSVPQFQRGFSWGQNQIEQFWEDINYAKKVEEEYFFGSLVFFTKSGKEFVIVDGQQRIALLNIFYAVIRDIYEELGLVQEADGVHNEYLGRVDRRSGKTYGNLELSKNDDDFFNRYILNRGKKDQKEKDFKKEKNLQRSNKLIFSAYRYLFTHLNKEISKKSRVEDKKEILCELEDTLSDKFITMSTHVNEESQAYVVFETLNARGLDLSINDLLKNHLFSKAEKDGNLNVVEKTWEEMADTLEEPSTINLFLRHFWMSSRGMVRQKDLYKALKAGVAQKGDVVKFVSELKEEAEAYAYLLFPEKQYWNDNEIVQLLGIINVLNVKQCLPLLLSGRKLKEFKELLKLIINFTFRYSTICNQSASTLEKLYSPIAVKVRTSSASIDEIKKTLKPVCPNDETFINYFIEFEVKNKNLIRYILGKLNDSMIPSGEMVSSKDTSKVNIEHILPKNPDAKWEKYLKHKKMVPKEWANKLGNLTILGSEFNRQASNKFFDIKKKEFYKKSKLPINRSLRLAREWDQNSIIKRQIELAKRAVKIWKIS